MKMLNIGCGSNYHADWINIDILPPDPKVLYSDLTKGLPFTNKEIDACYSSHLLEHLSKDDSLKLVSECYRVLKSNGIIRIVIPDLEGIARNYLEILNTVTKPDSEREADYDWIMLELYDQAVRDYPGGGMSKYLLNPDISNRDFVRSRIGSEVENFWNFERKHKKSILEKIKSNKLKYLLKKIRARIAAFSVFLIAGYGAYEAFNKGIFRDSGEIHRWMYDRYSMKRLLERSGFVDIKFCSPAESRIPEFEKYNLDCINGNVRKPDSLFVEGRKP